MPGLALIDYGCHYFTFRLTTQLAGSGLSIQYIANGSLESPNLTSLPAWEREHPSLIRIVRCRRPYGKMSLAGRLRGELEWAGHCIRALEQEKPAAAILSCLPISVATRIHTWCRRRKIPVVYWLQDMQGRAIHDLLGRKFGLPGKALGAAAQLWEQQIIEESRIVITIAAGHENELPESVRDQGRFATLENWIPIEDFPRFEPANDWSARHGLDETRNILYSGTLGLKHDLSVFTALAQRFAREQDIRVVVVSSGQAAEKLKQEASARNLSNLIVLPFQPQPDVPQVLASAAVLFAPLDEAAGRFCVPSKTLAYLCAGRPIVLAINEDNAAAQTILRAGAGSVVAPGDTAGFVRTVERFVEDGRLRNETGDKARAYAETTFASEQIQRRFLEILERSHILPLLKPQRAPAATVRKPFGIPICGALTRCLWLTLALLTVIAEVIPAPKAQPLVFYGLYSPAKLAAFFVLGIITPLAFGRLNRLTRGIAFAALSAAAVELLQGLIGNGHSFHWYELLVKLLLVLAGFMIGLDARFEHAIALGPLKIQLPSEPSGGPA